MFIEWISLHVLFFSSLPFLGPFYPFSRLILETTVGVKNENFNVRWVDIDTKLLYVM